MAILCSIGWFERKLMVVSVVVGLRNMLISKLDCFRITRSSRTLIHPLLSFVGLSFMLCVFGLCICWWGWGLFVWCRIWLGCRLHILCRILCFLCWEVVWCEYVCPPGVVEIFWLLYLSLVNPWISFFWLVDLVLESEVVLWQNEFH